MPGRVLLATKNALVRVEAYRVLADHEATPIISRAIDGQFAIDQVTTDGPPLVYASRPASPIAVFGQNISSISDHVHGHGRPPHHLHFPDGKSITVFDRPAD